MQSKKNIGSGNNTFPLGLVPINFLKQINTIQTSRKVSRPRTPLSAIPSELSNLCTQSFNVECNGKTVKIHAVQTGMVAVKNSHLTNRTLAFLTPLKITMDRNFTEFMPIWVWVIEHPEGVIVIDTGENAKVIHPNYFDPAGKLAAAYCKRNLRFSISKENEIGFQLRELGIRNENIKSVVLTHLHLDHTDGIKDFPDVEIIVNSDEYQNPSGHLPQLLPNWFKPNRVNYRKDCLPVFQKGYPITDAEDLFLIPTGGHTKHHASVLFKTDDFDILFAGDVSYTQEQLLEGDIPGIHIDYKESINTYNNIKQYAKDRKLIFLPSHDPNAMKRLKRGVSLF